jgi:hypothetical protein
VVVFTSMADEEKLEDEDNKPSKNPGEEALSTLKSFLKHVANNNQLASAVADNTGETKAPNDFFSAEDLKKLLDMGGSWKTVFNPVSTTHDEYVANITNNVNSSTRSQVATISDRCRTYLQNSLMDLKELMRRNDLDSSLAMVSLLFGFVNCAEITRIFDYTKINEYRSHLSVCRNTLKQARKERDEALVSPDLLEQALDMLGYDAIDQERIQSTLKKLKNV